MGTAPFDSMWGKEAAVEPPGLLQGGAKLYKLSLSCVQTAMPRLLSRTEAAASGLCRLMMQLGSLRASKRRHWRRRQPGGDVPARLAGSVATRSRVGGIGGRRRCGKSAAGPHWRAALQGFWAAFRRGTGPASIPLCLSLPHPNAVVCRVVVFFREGVRSEVGRESPPLLSSAALLGILGPLTGTLGTHN